MSDKLFMELYDDVFDSHTESVSDDDYKNVNSVILFNRLKAEYLKITNIKDYEIVQQELYEGKTRKDIIELEVVRIVNRADMDVIIMEHVVNIEKILKMYDNDISDELYEKMVNLIIKLQLTLGMKIGLFKELCCLFEKEKKKFDSRSNVSRKLTQVKKK